MPSGRVTIGVLILGFFGVRPPLAASPANGANAPDVTACQRQKNRLRHAPATPAVFGVHAVTPRCENSVTACDGTRLLPGRNSTNGSRPSRSMRQIDVRLKFNARAVCAIDSNRLSPGAVAPSISPDKMLSMRRSVSGFAANIALSLLSVVMWKPPFWGYFLFLTLPPKCPVCVRFSGTHKAVAPPFLLGLKKFRPVRFVSGFGTKKRPPRMKQDGQKYTVALLNSRLIGTRSRHAVSCRLANRNVVFSASPDPCHGHSPSLLGCVLCLRLACSPPPKP